MQTELTILILAALLQVFQFCAYSVTANMQVPVKLALGPRDQIIELTGTAGRLHRALDNHSHALLLFAIACIVIILTNQSNPFTQTCAWIYLGARVAYIPAYALGLSPWRSVVWIIGFGATALMLIAALL